MINNSRCFVILRLSLTFWKDFHFKIKRTLVHPFGQCLQMVQHHTF